MVGQRRGLGAIGRQAALEHFRIVVGTHLLAARSHFGDAILDALDQNSFVNLQLDDGIERHVARGQQLIERLRLRNGARETVEHKTVLRIRLADTIGDDRDHDFIGHELPGFHKALRAQPHFGARCHRCPQHIAGRKLNDLVFVDQT